MMDEHKLPYRHSVGLCIFNSEGRVFIAERRDTSGAWQMPQGGVQEGEDLYRTALREMKEEIGTNNADIIGKIPRKLRYTFPDWDAASSAHDLQFYKGKYCGQEQDWFALRFLGSDSEINLSGEHEPELPEFVSWRWEAIDKVVDLIVPFKQEVYQEVMDGFRPLAEAIKRGENPPHWHG